jgi:hypothetical protein
MPSILRTIAFVALISLTAPAFASVEGASPDLAVLGRCYMKFLLNQQVAAQAGIMAHEARQEDVPQIKQVVSDWSTTKTDDLRKELTVQFGDNARPRFEQFVGDYTTAEKSSDAKLLAQLGESFGFSPAPADYASLRKSAIESFLQSDMADGSKWLGEIQTWIDVRKKNAGCAGPVDLADARPAGNGHEVDETEKDDREESEFARGRRSRHGRVHGRG